MLSPLLFPPPLSLSQTYGITEFLWPIPAPGGGGRGEERVGWLGWGGTDGPVSTRLGYLYTSIIKTSIRIFVSSTFSAENGFKKLEYQAMEEKDRFPPSPLLFATIRAPRNPSFLLQKS